MTDGRSTDAGRRLTVQGWQNLVLSAMGVVVLAGLVAGGLLMIRTDRLSRELIDDIQPARVAAYQLQAALRDQETAVRGYVIAADQQFLDPYYAGQHAEKASGRRRPAARRHDGPTSSPIWTPSNRRAATGGRHTPSRSSPSVGRGVRLRPAASLTERGKSEFDRLRALFDRPERESADARGPTESRSSTSMRHWRDGLADRHGGRVRRHWRSCWRCWSEVPSPGRWPPLPRHAGASPRATSPSASSPRGPRDIRAIAADVEDMRQRIVDELEASRTATARRSTSRPRNCDGPTPNSSSSPTSPPTICRSPCARSHRSASCSRSATATNSTNAAPNTSGSRSTAPSGCRR